MKLGVRIKKKSHILRNKAMRYAVFSISNDPFQVYCINCRFYWNNELPNACLTRWRLPHRGPNSKTKFHSLKND